MKHKSFVLSAVTAVFVFTLCFPPGLPAQGKPVLHGTVYLKLATGQRPLAQAKIELREVISKGNKEEAGKMLFKTYSDSKGDFAFYGIHPGKYFVAVVRGKTVYSQLQGKKKMKMRPVTVSKSHLAKGLQITIVTVLGRP